MHNPKAGDARHGKEQLMAALAKAGHHATYQSTKERGFKKALNQPSDLVLAAGGDGTTAKVACRLIDSGIPLSVLPLGTANNLARALGFVASPEEIIARLEGGKKRAFDVGLADGPWGERYFLKPQAGDCLQITSRPQRKNRKRTGRLKSYPTNSRWRAMAHCYAGCCTTIRSVNGRSRLTEKIFLTVISFGKR
jgi:diacylglycerol kinase family enzyme